jgi:hypothetical protein
MASFLQREFLKYLSTRDRICFIAKLEKEGKETTFFFPHSLLNPPPLFHINSI